eukprot:scaffold12533_cov65-Cyclotella_meneghiniana.AAC.5
MINIGTTRGVSRFCRVDFSGIGKIPGYPPGRDNQGRDNGTGILVGIRYFKREKVGYVDT